MNKPLNFFVGIDPGKTGGVVVLDQDRSVVHAEVMPRTVDKDFDFRGWVLDCTRLSMTHGERIASLYIEVTFQQITRERGTKNVLPRMGAHEFAKVSGAQLAGAYLLAPDKVRVVHADVWRRAVGLTQYGATDTWKKAAKEACQRLWPQNPEVAKHPGIADAALMALAALEDWRRK
jgi:hypothetical protein